MGQSMHILQDIRSIREIEASLEDAEAFLRRVKTNKVKLTLIDGAYTVSREEMAKIADLITTLERSGAALESDMKYLRELMAYDEVTQMFSRRYIFHLIEKELHRKNRYNTNFSVLALELSMEQLGANLADLNLMVGEAGRIVRTYIRNTDSPGRTSEQMFMILLPETPASGALALAQRIQNSLQKTYETSVGQVKMMVSGAIVDSTNSTIQDMPSLLYAVDQRLSQARLEGPGALVGGE